MFSLKVKKMISTQPLKIGKLKASLFLGVLCVAIFGANFTLNSVSARDFLNTTFWYISPSDPYQQDWSDTVSINTDDNWDNFIAVTGYRGDGLTAAEGVSPQTVLADGSSTPLDVIANQSDPNEVSLSGVAEFDGIANPTVALKGSATASAPHLVIRINTKSCPETKYMTVGYKVRDLDSSATNATQQVALHYRMGDTGNYTNVPTAFVADATQPNAATRVSTVFVTLPQVVLQQDRLYLRIMTTNAGGNDEWVGIDDISVGCFVPTSTQAEIAGTVLGEGGRTVPNTIVTMTDPAGYIHSTRTNSFGTFSFKNAAIGLIYVLEVKNKAHRYTPQIVIVSSDVSGLEFTPETDTALLETAKSPPKQR